MFSWLSLVEPQTSQLHLTVLSKLGGSIYNYITVISLSRIHAEVGSITGEMITVSQSMYTSV